VNPHEALRLITEIRERMARSQDFQGFASLAVAFSSLLAFVGAASQRYLVPSPMEDLSRYLLIWIIIAALSLSAAAMGLRSWTKRTGSELGREKTILAIEQVAPCLVVGALLTFFVYRDAPELCWVLPGLWSLLFSLGVFASRRMLSREVFWVGVYYVAAGTVCLSLGHGIHALAPWQMELCFGGGQLVGAAVLYWTVERPDA
jgi:hypothetical protein